MGGRIILLPKSIIELLGMITKKLINILRNKHKNRKIQKIFNICPDGYISRYDLAKYIFKQKRYQKKINFFPIKSSQFGKNIRPLNSKLNTNKIKNFLNIDIKDWSIYLNKYLKKI